MMWYWGSGYGWGVSVVGILMMLVFWGGIFALAVPLVRSITASRSGQDAALEALRRGRAAGAIISGEHERIRRQLV